MPLEITAFGHPLLSPACTSAFWFCVPGPDASHQMLTATCHDSCAPEEEIKMASHFPLLHAWKPASDPSLLQPHGACKALESSAFAFGTQLLLQAFKYLHVYLAPRPCYAHAWEQLM